MSPRLTRSVFVASLAVLPLIAIQGDDSNPRLIPGKWEPVPPEGTYSIFPAYGNQEIHRPAVRIQPGDPPFNPAALVHRFGAIALIGGSFDDVYGIDFLTGHATRILESVDDDYFRALAFDPDTTMLYAIIALSNSSRLYRIDTTTQDVTFIATLFSATPFVEGLAVDPVNGVLYGVRGTSLLKINMAKGFVEESVPIGGASELLSLTFDPISNFLYGTDSGGQLLHVIDPENPDGATSVDLSAGSVEGLGFDVNRELLYGTSVSGNNLVLIDPGTGGVTTIGPLGVTLMRGLAGASVATDWDFSPGAQMDCLYYVRFDGTSWIQELVDNEQDELLADGCFTNPLPNPTEDSPGGIDGASLVNQPDLPDQPLVAWAQRVTVGEDAYSEILVARREDPSGEWTNLGEDAFGIPSNRMPGISRTFTKSTDPVLVMLNDTPVVGWLEDMDSDGTANEAYVRWYDETANPPHGQWVEMGSGSANDDGVSESGGTTDSFDLAFYDVPERAEDVVIVAYPHNGRICLKKWDSVLEAWVAFSEGSADWTTGGISGGDEQNPDTQPTIATYPDSAALFIAWVRGEANQPQTLMGRQWTGSQWIDVGSEIRTSTNIQRPTAATTLEGSLVVAWEERSTPWSQILARQWDGFTWSEIGPGSSSGGGISGSTVDSTYPRLVMEPGNQPVLAWDENGLAFLLRFDQPLITAPDCNENGVSDVVDIAGGESADCNENGIPDECDVPSSDGFLGGYCTSDCSEDCNENGVPDECEPDCDENGVADECEVVGTYDCNENGIADFCDIDNETSEDCNGNVVPDECEIDHNCCETGHGPGCSNPAIEACVCALDPFCCDIVWDDLCVGHVVACGGCARDCNNNGTLDDCDLLDGTSADCQPNDVPDECELNVFRAESEELSPIGWPDDEQSFTLDSPPQATSDVTLTFEASADLEDSQEWIYVSINGTVIGNVFEFSGSECPGSAFPDADQLLVLMDDFNTAAESGYVTIDMVGTSEVAGDECSPDSFISVSVAYDTTGMPNDCNSNAVPDQCDLADGTSYDCNSNITPDECDIADGTSEDCNANGTPDECEPDCNTNGIPDECDIADGASQDCNSNNAPDQCDILAGTSHDCNANDIPDECEPDCNANGIPDVCDVEPLCPPKDPGEPGFPDECSLDCNANCIPDECEIPWGDCQLPVDLFGFGIPDDCDIADCDAEWCQDENENGVPDGCEADCDENGIPDDWDILGEPELDSDGDAILDTCEADLLDGLLAVDHVSLDETTDENGWYVLDLDTLEGGLATWLSPGIPAEQVVGGVACNLSGDIAYVLSHDPTDDNRLYLYQIEPTMGWAAPLGSYNTKEPVSGTAGALAFDDTRADEVLYVGYQALDGTARVQIVNATNGELVTGAAGIGDYSLGTSGVQLQGFAHHRGDDDLYATCSVGALYRLYRVQINEMSGETTLTPVDESVTLGVELQNLAFDVARNRLVGIAEGRLYQIDTVCGTAVCVGAGFARSAAPRGLAYNRLITPAEETSPWAELPDGSARGAGLSRSCSDSVEPSIAIDGESGAPIVVWADGTLIRARKYAPDGPEDLAPWKNLDQESGIGEGGVVGGLGGHTPFATGLPGGAEASVPLVAWSHESVLGSREIFVKKYQEDVWQEMGVGSAQFLGISGTLTDSLEPVVAVDPAGNPFIAWDEVDEDTGFHQVYLRKWDVGAMDWVEVGAGSASGFGLSASLDRAVDVELIADAFGRPIIAWADRDAEDDDYDILVFYWDGLGWWGLGPGSVTEEEEGDPVFEDRHPSLAADAAGNVFLAWSACEDADCAGPSQIKVLKWDEWDGGVWTSLGESTQAAGISGTPGPSLTADVVVTEDNHVVVAWRDTSVQPAEPAVVLVRQWDGEEWVEVGAGSAVGGTVSVTAYSEEIGTPQLAIAQLPSALAGNIFATWDHRPLGPDEFPSGTADIGRAEVYVRHYSGPPIVGAPTGPYPAPGEINVGTSVAFRFTPGANAASCVVLVGTSTGDLTEIADLPVVPGQEEELDPYEDLEEDLLYYWRVDSFGEPGSGAIPLTGPVWNFWTTEPLNIMTEDEFCIADVAPVRGVTGFEQQGYQNRGADPQLAIGQAGSVGQFRRTLARFDLCEWSDRTVVEANLKIEVTSAPSTGVTVEVYTMRQDWVEGAGYTDSGNSAGNADGASWNTSDGFHRWLGQSAPNMSDGAGYTERASESGPGTVPMGTATLPAGQTGTISVPLDSAKVQEWASRDVINYGLLIKLSGSDENLPDTIVEFESREAGSPPQLELSFYESGEPLSDLTVGDIDPNSGPTTGESIPLSITGTGFTSGVTVTFVGTDHRVTVPSELIDVASDTDLTCPLPPFPPGHDCANVTSFIVKVVVSNACPLSGVESSTPFSYIVTREQVTINENLQSFVTGALPGTCIVLDPGVHDGPVSFLSGASALTLTSVTPTQPGLTKIDGVYRGEPEPQGGPTVTFNGSGGDILLEAVGDGPSALVSGAPIVLTGVNVRLGNSGVLVTDASPLIKSCRIDDNFAEAAFAGGITIRNDAHPVILDCAVEGNIILQPNGLGGGIRVGDGCIPTIVGCSIASNMGGNHDQDGGTSGTIALGGGLYLENTSPDVVIANNDIRGNHADGDGGGVCWRGLDAGTAAGRFFLNRVEGNTAGGNGPGLYCDSDSSPAIENNLLDRNGYFADSNFGGGIFVAEFNTNPISIRENVIRYNTALVGGAAYFDRKAAPVLTRNIIAANTVEEPYDAESCPEPPVCVEYFAPGIFATDAEPDLINNTVHANYRKPPQCCTEQPPDEEQGGGFHGEILVTGDADFFDNVFTVNSGWEAYADVATTAVEVLHNLTFETDSELGCDADYLITPTFTLYTYDPIYDCVDPSYDGIVGELARAPTPNPDPDDIAWPRVGEYPDPFAVTVIPDEVPKGAVKWDGTISQEAPTSTAIDDGTTHATMEVPKGVSEETKVSIEVHREPVVNGYVAAWDPDDEGPAGPIVVSYFVLYELEGAEEIPNATLEIPVVRPFFPGITLSLYQYNGSTLGGPLVYDGTLNMRRWTVTFSLEGGIGASSLPGDCDGDGDVDLDDFRAFSDCLTGPREGGASLPDECQACDLDDDADVTLRDFGVFERTFGTGS